MVWKFRLSWENGGLKNRMVCTTKRFCFDGHTANKFFCFVDVGMATDVTAVVTALDRQT